MELVNDRLPAIARELIGPLFGLAKTVLPDLNNDILMHALDAKAGRDIRSFYIDLDLAIGKSSSRLIFVPHFETSTVLFSLGEEEWRNFSRLCADLSAKLAIDPLSESRVSITQHYNEIINGNQYNLGELSKLDARIAENEGCLLRARHVLTEGEENLRKCNPTIVSLETELDKLTTAMESSTAEEALEVKKRIRSIDRKLAKMTVSLEPLEKEVNSISAVGKKLTLRRTKLAAEIVDPKYEGSICGSAIAEVISTCRNMLSSQIEVLNASLPGTEKLRTFLLRAEGIFQAGATILASDILSSSLGMRRGINLNASAGARLTVPVGRILDTGLNVLLLGEAGAGKTTSLQNYAAARLECARAGEIILFASLSRVVDSWVRDDNEIAFERGHKLERGIVSYLRQIGLAIDINQLGMVFHNGGSVLLLDAIDEVVKNYPWIISSIGDLARRYPKLQVVTTSRTSAKGLDSLNFVTLTLLPFTDSQRKQFIKSWFQSEEEQADRVLRHLSRQRELKEIVRNPLLATILCVLQENSIPLPDSEIRLYEERMRLLIGDYDIHKRVKRITSQRYFLRLASQKIAYRLHVAARREGSREEFYEWTCRALRGQLPSKACHTLVDELVDPCGILCPMTEDGRLGFGHLRYQEYLVALELLQNRSIHILEVARQGWWRGVMVMFSKLNESIEWFLKELVIGNTIQIVQDVAMAMIEARPREERLGLRSYLTENTVIDEINQLREALVSGEFGFDDEEADNAWKNFW